MEHGGELLDVLLAGAASTGFQGAAGAAVIVSLSMSFGSAMTTGPGRPLVAVWKARETYSGTRSATSISVAHLAIGPKAAR